MRTQNGVVYLVRLQWHVRVGLEIVAIAAVLVIVAVAAVCLLMGVLYY